PAALPISEYSTLPVTLCSFFFFPPNCFKSQTQDVSMQFHFSGRFFLPRSLLLRSHCYYHMRSVYRRILSVRRRHGRCGSPAPFPCFFRNPSPSSEGVPVQESSLP